MSLRKRPTLTLALLADNRADARHSTGLRTVEGKNRIVLNALKGGRYARDLGEKLQHGKSQEDADLFHWILYQVQTAFRLHGWEQDTRKAEPGVVRTKTASRGGARSPKVATQPKHLLPGGLCESASLRETVYFFPRSEGPDGGKGGGRNKPGMCPGTNR